MNFKKILLLLILLIPVFVSAEEDEGKLVASAEKYYKTTTVFNNSSVLRNANLGEMSSITTEITKEEYESAPVENNLARGTDDYTDITVETTYKKMTATIREFYDEYRYKNVLTWKNIPSTRSYDIIALGYYASVTPASGVFFEQDYCTSSDSCYTTSSYYEYSGANGSAALFYLPTGTLTSLKQSLRLDMKKTNSSSTIISQIASADYSHATKSISYSNAKKFSVDTGGIRLQTSIEDYYDSITVATASWEGEW